MAVEYTVRPVVRYFVTRWQDGVSQGAAWNTGSSYCGTFDNVEMANAIAVALAAQEPGAKPVLLTPYGNDGTIGKAAALVTRVCDAQLGRS